MIYRKIINRSLAWFNSLIPISEIDIKIAAGSLIAVVNWIEKNARKGIYVFSCIKKMRKYVT